MKLKHAFQRGVASALIAGVVLTAGLPALAAGAADGAEPESTAVTQMLVPSDEEVPLSVTDEEVPLTIEDDDTPLSITIEEVPLSGDGQYGVTGNGFWGLLFQLLEHLAGRR